MPVPGRFFSIVAAFLIAPPAFAQDAPCGGDWDAFLDALVAEAVAGGVPGASARAVVEGAREDADVLAADRAQGHFQADFLTFSQRLISQDRVERAARQSEAHEAAFARIEAELGVPRGILLAFWAFETDFGAVQGDFDTTDALLTLAHDCRRPALFRPEAIAAMRLHALGRWDTGVTGAWAGEIGQVQMLPRDILEFGADGDGDGVVDLKVSSDDALLSGGRMLAALGWRADEPWLREVTVLPDMDWSLAGTERTLTGAEWAALGVAPRERALPDDLPASLILPVGRRGPAFLAYDNFRVLGEWNQSLTYVLTAAYFATRIEGAARYAAGEPEAGLGPEEIGPPPGASRGAGARRGRGGRHPQGGHAKSGAGRADAPGAAGGFLAYARVARRAVGRGSPRHLAPWRAEARPTPPAPPPP